MDDIINGKDIHRQTASIVYQKPMDKVTSEERTKSKAISFSPLYGAKGNNAEPHIKRYYDDFYQIYTGIKRWHKELTDTVLKTTLVEENSLLSRLLRFNICTAYAKGNLISSSITVKGCRYLT